MVRKHVVVSGRVQGVGFRYSARKRAVALGITGYARNTPEGTVEAEIEGEPADVEAMLAWLRQGPRGARVRSVDVAERPVAGDAEFRITG